jgi:hypothetical protein
MAREGSGLRWGPGLAGAVVGLRVGRTAAEIRRPVARGSRERGAERRAEDSRNEGSGTKSRMSALDCTSAHLCHSNSGQRRLDMRNGGSEECGVDWPPLVSRVIFLPEFHWIRAYQFADLDMFDIKTFPALFDNVQAVPNKNVKHFSYFN